MFAVLSRPLISDDLTTDACRFHAGWSTGSVCNNTQTTRKRLNVPRRMQIPAGRVGFRWGDPCCKNDYLLVECGTRCKTAGDNNKLQTAEAESLQYISWMFTDWSHGGKSRLQVLLKCNKCNRSKRFWLMAYPTAWVITGTILFIYFITNYLKPPDCANEQPRFSCSSSVY